MQIVCLCHLAWESTLFQRPHQLMLRFARAGHDVHFFGCVGGRRFVQMLGAGGRAAVRGEIPSGNGVLRFENLPFSAFTSAPSPISREFFAHRIVEEVDSERTARDVRVQWLYHPSLLSLGEHLAPDLVVYDVMDRFASFEKSRDRVSSDEERLLNRADVVFAGGRSLQAHALAQLQRAGSRKPVHFQPSGVELEHFEQALSPELVIPAEIANLPRPIFGYFGAVDERLDYSIIAQLSAATDGSVVLIGPVLNQPPRIPNLHVLGPRSYQQLPAYVKAFNVALLPFVQSALVAHISPTKTPEYLAGGKPVVSTSIPDVVRDYRDIVVFADAPDDFARVCVQLAEVPPHPSRQAAGARARAKTWDRVATEMLDEVTKALRVRR